MSNFEQWSKKQGVEYMKSKAPLIVPEMTGNFVVYKITIETMIGIYTYIGQTSCLERRVKQHQALFKVIMVRILESCKTRQQALLEEAVNITLASRGTLLNKMYNLQYEAGTRELILGLHRYRLG